MREIAAAGSTTVSALLRQRAAIHGERIALRDDNRTLDFRGLDGRVDRLAHVLHGLGVVRGGRVAILSENRGEYIEALFACGRLGAILCCLNWRLSERELTHCVDLVEPKRTLVSPRFRDILAGDVILGADYERRLAAAPPEAVPECAEPEDPLLIIYTSGTTGLPKGAAISHRAEIWRAAVLRADMRLREGDRFVAWPPMFHMASSEQATGVLLAGGHVVPVDGFDPERLVREAGEGRHWWYVLMPGAIEAFVEEARRRNLKPAPIRLCGAMADLIPSHQIAEATLALNAPFLNSFGSTETGIPPASAGIIPVGEAPTRLSKTVNSFTDFRLVDPDDNAVAPGEPGELALRGPTLFSGYWNAEETNARDFRGGRFHMGDCFRRNPDGTLDFVDRVKYLIKSGGENIYPAEVERILLADPRVDEALVVRRPDPHWGEVPVAYVARNDPNLDEAALNELCLNGLARYKRPREINFVPVEAFPRSTTGKIQRHEVEKWNDNAEE